jgi:hypothetical protein
VTVKQKTLIREGREGARRKPGRSMILVIFTSRPFASFADKKGFPA